MAWLDTIQTIGLAGLAIGTVVVGITICRQNRREARHVADPPGQLGCEFWSNPGDS